MMLSNMGSVMMLIMSQRNFQKVPLRTDDKSDDKSEEMSKMKHSDFMEKQKRKMYGILPQGCVSHKWVRCWIRMSCSINVHKSSEGWNLRQMSNECCPINLDVPYPSSSLLIPTLASLHSPLPHISFPVTKLDPLGLSKWVQKDVPHQSPISNSLLGQAIIKTSWGVGVYH